MKRASLLLIAFVAIFWASSSVSFSKTLKGGVSVSANIRTNKHGKKVDLTKAPGYRVAVTDYYKGRYGPAAQEFETLDRNGFCCDMVHYYIALCYQGCGQLTLAAEHFEWVTAYSKDPKLRTYADTAYQQLAYYGGHRTYGGQGNNFDKGMLARSGGGGGGRSFG
jgi:hypothetical protein